MGSFVKKLINTMRNILVEKQSISVKRIHYQLIITIISLMTMVLLVQLERLQLSSLIMVTVRMERIKAVFVLVNNTAELPYLNIMVKKMIGKFENWMP